MIAATVLMLVGLGFAALADLPVQYAPIACAVGALIFSLWEIAHAIRDTGRRES